MIERPKEMAMPIDLVHLRTFVAVAEEGHLTRAAERLFISQPTASSHVRALEERLKLRLFVRTNRSLVLTSAGQIMVRKAKALLTEDALFLSSARALHGEVEGKLVIGTSNEPGTRIGEMVIALREKYPLVNVDLSARQSSGIRQGLHSGELDVGVLLGKAIESSCICYKLTDVQYRVVGPAAWREKIVSADWVQLASLPWLTPSSGSAYSGMLTQLFGDRGLELNSVLRFDSSVIGRRVLQAGGGLMLVREEEAMQGERNGELALSPIARTEMTLLLAHQRGRQDDPLIDAFIRVAREVWPEMHLNEPTGEI